MSFWDALKESVKDTAGRVGSATAAATAKAKLKAELLLIEREITAREQAFGVELYDYVAPLSKHPSFYSSDDTLTVTLQPPLITAQREIAALQIKQGKQQEKINQAKVNQAASYKPATNWQETVLNLGKSTANAGSDTLLSTEMAMLNSQVKSYKQQFGVTLYSTLEELEDHKQWLPTDREIRSIYDNCRRDVEKIKKRKQAKEEEMARLEGMDGSGSSNYDAPTNGTTNLPSMYANSTVAQPSTYATSMPESSAPQVPQPAAPTIPSYGTTSHSQPASSMSFDFAPSPAAPPAQDPFAPSNIGYGAAAAPLPQDPFAAPPPTNGLFAGISPPTNQSFPAQQQQQQHYNPQPHTFPPQHQQSAPHDPFASAPPPQTVAFDPFSTTTATSAGGNISNAANPKKNEYHDPFAGL